MKISNIRIIEDGTESVSCSGDKASGSHPKIFLKVIEEKGSIECYYCGKLFIYRSKFEKK
tara:strand:+ start:308 stop:487 length:180 start_codon:yes stop_codon:yes gene_type:complete